MKKIFSFILSIFFLFPLFSQEEILIYSETFNCDELNSIHIDITDEQVLIQKYKGDEILIEFDSNNLNYKPILTFRNNEITIKSANYHPVTVDYCKINIYLPVNYKADQIFVKSIYGSITIKDISIINDFTVKTDGGILDISGVKTDTLQVSSFNSDIICHDMKCDSLIIDSINGNIDISILSNLTAVSVISSSTRSINFTYPSDSDFDIMLFARAYEIAKKTDKIFVGVPTIVSQNNAVILVNSPEGTVIINNDK